VSTETGQLHILMTGTTPGGPKIIRKSLEAWVERQEELKKPRSEYSDEDDLDHLSTMS
jgi:hypothetical protein